VAGSSLVTFFVQREGGAVVDLDVVPLSLRLSNSIVSYIAYIGHMFWPTDLAALYPLPSAIPLWKSAAALSLLVALTVSAIMAVRRFPYVTVGWFWYLGILFPVIGIVQVGSQAMADRYTYIPLIGLFVIIAWGSYDLLGRGSKKRAPMVVLGLLMVVALAVATWVQSQYWLDARVLWIRTLAVTSDNYRAHALYGKALSAEGLMPEALAQYKKVVLIEPAFSQVQTLLGNALVDLGQPEKAVPYYEESLRLQPDFQPTHNGFGNALAAVGRIDEAMVHYQRALELKPEDPLAHNGLGSTLDDLGRVDEAIEQYHKALEFDPEYAAAHSNLAAAFARQGRIEEAVSEMRVALEYESDNPDYHYNYALLINQQGDIAQAVRHLEQVLELDPQNQGARRTLLTLRGNIPKQ
jgi:Flp pilus assembly protein TadD